ncbi:MAG TPA: hypothetical protein VFH38_12940 [Jatrophihabitans sp.]|nr:hypothetical protein [Jatrophihabitans sp.]
MTYPPPPGSEPAPQPGQPQYQPGAPAYQPGQPQYQPGSYPQPGQAGAPYAQQYPGAPAPPPPGGVRKRGRTPLRLALIFGVIGVVLLVVGGIVGFSAGLNKVDNFQRVSVAQGRGTIHLNAGNYLAYYESPDYNTSSNSVPVVIVQMRNSRTGALVTGQLYGNRSDRKVSTLTYDHNGHHGAALYQFSIKTSGNYDVALGVPPSSNASPRSDMAFGPSIAGGLAAGGILAIVGVLLIIAAVVLLIVGLVQRSKGSKQPAAVPYGPPPGSGYPPPQQPGSGYSPPDLQKH